MPRKWAWCAVAFVLLLPAADAAGQETESRLLPTLAGGGLGILGGGYVALAVVVAEARAGNYLHDFQDVFGWRSLPVVAGGALGGGLGFYSPERLKQAVIWGYIGIAAGGAVGLGVGQLFGRPPEGKWAGMAIGAGAGLVAGYLAGALTARADEDLTSGGAALVVPLTIRLPL